MFNPEMLAAAQKMMANMSPEQMAKMAEMASKMDPNMLRNMTGGNAGLPMPSPSQFEEAKEKMKKMSPEDMKDMFESAKHKMSGQNAYMVNGATVLKNEGNDKVRAGDYAGAVEIFSRALENLEGCPTPDDSVYSLIQSVKLNAALCYLKLADFSHAMNMCEGVLSRDPVSIKALYRRGLAHRGLSNNLQAALDIKKAYLLSDSSDEIIRKELEDTVRLVTEESDLETIESFSLESVPASEPAPPLVGGSIEKAKEILEKDPEMINKIGDMISEMDVEKLNGLLEMSAAGLPADAAGNLGDMKAILKNKEFMKSMSEMMKNMDMNAFQGMANNPSASSSPPDMSSMMSDPAMVSNIQSMMDSMPDSVLEDMIKSQLSEGQSLPGFMTAGRMKWVAKRVMGVMRIWMNVKRAVAAMMTRNGKIMISAIVLSMAFYMQYGQYMLQGDDKPEDKRPEEL